MMRILEAKAALVILSTLVMAFSYHFAGRVPGELLARFRRFDVPLLWLLARAVPVCAVYFVAGFAPESDVATCFWPQAVGAAAGAVPYRDFESFFGPLFPYLLAVPVLLWQDPRALIVWLSLLEAGTIALTTRAAGLRDPGVARTRFLLCAFLAPGPLMFSVIGGQEDFLIWAAGLLTWLAIRKTREGFAGGITAGAFLATKAVFLVPFAAFLGIVRSRPRYLAIVIPAGVATVGILWWLTGRSFLGVLGQSGDVSPPQLWLLLHLASGGWIPYGGAALSFIALAATLVGAFAVGSLRRGQLRSSWPAFAAAWVLVLSMMCVVFPKGQGAYLAYLLLPALFFAIKSPVYLAVWTLAGAIGAVEPSLFYRLGQQKPAAFSQIQGVLGGVDLILQAVLIGSLLWIAHRSWRLMREVQP